MVAHDILVLPRTLSYHTLTHIIIIIIVMSPGEGERERERDIDKIKLALSSKYQTCHNSVVISLSSAHKTNTATKKCYRHAVVWFHTHTGRVPKWMESIRSTQRCAYQDINKQAQRPPRERERERMVPTRWCRHRWQQIKTGKLIQQQPCCYRCCRRCQPCPSHVIVFTPSTTWRIT